MKYQLVTPPRKTTVSLLGLPESTLFSLGVGELGFSRTSMGFQKGWLWNVASSKAITKMTDLNFAVFFLLHSKNLSTFCINVWGWPATYTRSVSSRGQRDCGTEITAFNWYLWAAVVAFIWLKLCCRIIYCIVSTGVKIFSLLLRQN